MVIDSWSSRHLRPRLVHSHVDCCPLRDNHLLPGLIRIQEWQQICSTMFRHSGVSTIWPPFDDELFKHICLTQCIIFRIKSYWNLFLGVQLTSQCWSAFCLGVEQEKIHNAMYNMYTNIPLQSIGIYTFSSSPPRDYSDRKEYKVT